MGIFDDVGEFVTGRRGGVRNLRDVERGVVNIERTLNRVENFDERREIRNNGLDARVYRSREQLERARDRYEGRDDNDDRRGGRDDDRRGDFASGRGGQGPRGFTGGQPRSDDRDGPGQDQSRNDPREAANEFVLVMSEAVRAPVGSAERAAALREAQSILTNPENGLKREGSERIQFPDMDVRLDSRSGITFEGMHGRAASAQAAIATTARSLANQNIGTALTQAEIDALRGAAAGSVTVGTGTPTPATPAPDAPPAPATGAATPAAPAAATFSLPSASGPEAQIYTRNRAGRTMNAEDAPKMSASQVEAIQRELGVEADGKWGPDTQAAFARAAQAAGVNPRDVDFTNPNDPETVRVIAQFNAPSPAASAGVATPPTPTAATGTPDAPGAAAPAAPDAARLDAAVNVLTAVAGADKEVSAGNISAIQSNAELTTRIGRAFDLNNNGRVEETELTQIAAAAAAKPEAERVTVVGGVAALNPLFAGTSFAPVQPATDVASVTSPAPGLAQTAQVSPQTGEVTPPAAAPASAPLRTENAVYVVPEQIFEPPSPNVPDVRAPGQRSGGFTIA